MNTLSLNNLRPMARSTLFAVLLFVLATVVILEILTSRTTRRAAMTRPARLLFLLWLYLAARSALKRSIVATGRPVLMLVLFITQT
ncbi:MAG: hypothetical protein Q8K50_05545, partial [Hydrogenophaga sp.]|nr:hypothetical protein [Hydrogenophaga sp.]